MNELTQEQRDELRRKTLESRERHRRESEPRGTATFYNKLYDQYLLPLVPALILNGLDKEEIADRIELARDLLTQTHDENSSLCDCMEEQLKLAMAESPSSSLEESPEEAR